METETTFDVLSSLLRPYAEEMTVKSDTKTNFYLEEARSSETPQMFAAVQLKKNYISFHLFPVYTDSSLLEDLSSELRKRMQGKSCFNFKTIEPAQLSELDTLVRRAYQSLSK